MQRETHVVFGFLLAAVLWAFFDLSYGAVITAAAGAILPDLDFQKPLRSDHRK